MAAAPFHPAVADPTDPASLTPDQRLAELCAILAAGARRVMALRAHPAGATPLPAGHRYSAPIELDLSAEQSVHGRPTG